LTLAPVAKNDDWEYEAGEQFALPGVRRIEMEQDITRQTLHADDQVYLDLFEYHGTRVSIVLAELGLDLLVKMGFGKNEDDGSVTWIPQGMRNQFCLSFACKQDNEEYRMHRMFVFTIDEIMETSLSSIGDGNTAFYEIEGTFVRRNADGKVAQMKDGPDLAWLEQGPGVVADL